MKVLVAVKRVVDPGIRIQVKSDQTGVDLTSAKMTMNPFDEIAVEEAVRLKESGNASEIVAVSIGPGRTVDVLRYAMAMGADRAIHIPAEGRVEPLAVAKLLAAVVRTEQPDLVMLGKQAIDDDSNQTGQMLSALLGWSQGTFVSRLEPSAGAIVVTREIDGGLQRLELRLPAVVSTDLRLNTPRHVSLPNVMKAKRQPLAEMTPDSLGVDITPRQQILRVETPPKRKAGMRVSSVDELIDRLRNEAGIL